MNPGGPGVTTGEGGTAAGGEGGSTAAGDPAEILYRGLQTQIETTCGGPNGGCHITAMAFATAPKFLAGPDSYKSIKAYPNIVVKDVFSSIIITKGQHEGPSIFDEAPDSSDSLSARVTGWLNQESVELQNIVVPSTDPVAVTLNADNDIDLVKLENGVTGVHLKFHATLIGTSLSLTNLSLLTAAGTAVHFQHPIFYQVPATKQNPADPDNQDPQDSFSNTDVTVPGGATTSVPPGTVILSGFTWTATDKLRIEAYKLEPGTIPEAATVASCTNPALFGSMVAPILRGGAPATPLNCTGCHGNNGNGQGALDLSGIQNGGTNFAATCAAVLNKVVKTPGSEATSMIIQKPAGTISHAGGKVADTATWTTDFTNFIKGGTIF